MNTHEGKWIIGIGELLWDVFPEGKVIGGAPCNFAYHVSQLGWKGCGISAIGKDALGEEILEELSGKKFDFLVDKTEYPTGTVQVTLDDAGVPSYEICENVGWDNIPFNPETAKIARDTIAVCFGSLAQRSAVSRASIRSFLREMPARSLKIFDINLRQKFYSAELLTESLELSNILKINDDEVEIVGRLFGWEGLSEKEVCMALKEKYSLQIVILTKGTNGSYIFSNEGESFLETPCVRVADTVGAGDSFTAGFIAIYIKTGDIPKAHRAAVTVSAYVCTCSGAMPELSGDIIEEINS